MGNKDLHPSIKEFKEFVQKHPGLIKKVRSGNESWQDYYEKWVLLGEDDPSWEKYKQPEGKNYNNHEEDKKQSKNTKKEKKEKKELMNSLMKMVENVDLNKVEGHINQLNGAITNIQSLLHQFQDGKKKSQSDNGNRPPFNLNQD